MTKQVKAILYASAGVVLLGVTIFALIISSRLTKTSVPNVENIDGARASSYQTTLGSLEIKEGDLVLGSEKAPLKIFVYEDFSSPLSASLAETLEQLSKENNGRLAIIVRPFVQSNNSLSLEAALAYSCALEVNKGKEMRVKLFDLARESVFNSSAVLEEVKNLKLNEEVFNTCLTNQEKSLKLEEEMAAARLNLVLGAPTMFVGDEMILGARPYSDFVDSNGDAIEGLKTVVERKLGEL